MSVADDAAREVVGACSALGRTAAVVLSDGAACAVMLPGPARGRVVVRFEGERSEIALGGATIRRLFG